MKNNEIIEIDGSIGYGQVLRSAIALSCLTLKPVKIFNIRKGRPRAGLMAQHLVGVKIASEFCSAETKGLKLYSTELEFYPKSFNVESKKIDIGSAGQISLFLQTLTPLLIFSRKEVSLEIIGGTAGLGAPTIQFLQNITFPTLSKLGVKQPEVEIVREGFYPRGGGIVKIRFFPGKKLSSINLTERGKVKRIKGISICGSLPKHVAERQADSAKKILMEKGFENAEIEEKAVNTLSPGTSITLWAECENSILGADNIGKRGVRAEEVGQKASLELIEAINSGATVDKWMSDQILIFLVLAEGKSLIKAPKLTEHAKTNLEVLKHFFDFNYRIIGEEPITIEIEGVGFQK